MKADSRFALLTNGSAFSRYVAESLLASRYLPSLIALPDYPPADTATNENFNIQAVSPQPKIITLLPGIPVVYAPASNSRALIQYLGKLDIDYILVACWPYLIDTSIYRCPHKAALNLHPSLLPAYRGPDPLNQQISNRETKLGVTLHLLNDKFDQGDIVAQAGFKVADTELALDHLQRQCAILGVELFIHALNDFSGEGWRPVPQGCA